MASRMDLQHDLEAILGTREVYFQKPSNKKMSYPCIVYDFAKPDLEYADNAIYIEKNNYTITLITIDPYTTIYDELLHYPYCKFDRKYKSDNLNHFVFNITI